MTLNGFDWWLIVIIPFIVGLATYYVGKLLDIASGRSLRFYRRWSIRRDVADCVRTMHHIADGNLVVVMISRLGFFISVTATSASLLGLALAALFVKSRPEGAGLQYVWLLPYVTGLVSLAVQVNVLMNILRLRNAALAPIKYVEGIRTRIAEFPKDFKPDMMNDLEAMAQHVMQERKARYKQMYAKGDVFS